MKKRLVSLLCMGVLVVGMMSGCNQEAVEGSKREKVSGGEKGRTSDEILYAENLTEGLDTQICIDYAIKSYEPVQTFSYELFEQSMSEDNPVLSPVSAYLALGMAGTGAKGATLSEFQQVLGTDLDCIPHSLMSTLPRDMEGMKIALANSVWVDDDFEAEKDYLVEIDSFYFSEVYRATLSVPQTMQDMNAWINENTNGLIPTLVEEPLDKDVMLALFNTIYFKGEWEKAFSEKDTQERDFYREDGIAEQVEMMHLYGEKLQYVNTEESVGVVLPYKDENMVFVALMPAITGNQTVREMYENMEWSDICAILQEEKYTPCNLQLPKFEVTFERKLNSSLQAMGLKKAFDGAQADLSAMGKTKDGTNIFIDLVFQKAVVIVDEEGTEAAAVTQVLVTKESCVIEEPPVNIFFNEPFLYMIVDKEKEIPLFMGIMDNPNK